MKPPKNIVNFTPATHRRSFGDNADDGVKAKMIQLVASVRTLMKSTFFSLLLSV